PRRPRQVAVLSTAGHSGAGRGGARAGTTRKRADRLIREKSIMKRLAGLLTAGIALASTSGMLCAQDRYPSQSIKFVVPFAAGSATDTLARLLGHRVTTALGQNVVIENIAGGSGVIAAQTVVRSAADGHTVFIT